LDSQPLFPAGKEAKVVLPQSKLDGFVQNINHEILEYICQPRVAFGLNRVRRMPQLENISPLSWFVGQEGMEKRPNFRFGGHGRSLHFLFLKQTKKCQKGASTIAKAVMIAPLLRLDALRIG
jgi:hypothetical protein